MAKNGIRCLASNREVLFQVPNGFVLNGAGVAERMAEDFAEKIALQLGFVELGKAATGFEIGPADKDGMGAVNVSVVESKVVGSLFEVAAEDQPICFRLAYGAGRIILEQRELHGSNVLPRWASKSHWSQCDPQRYHLAEGRSGCAFITDGSSRGGENARERAWISNSLVSVTRHECRA